MQNVVVSINLIGAIVQRKASNSFFIDTKLNDEGDLFTY